MKKHTRNASSSRRDGPSPADRGRHPHPSRRPCAAADPPTPMRGEWIYGRHPVRELLRAGKRHIYEILDATDSTTAAGFAADAVLADAPADAVRRVTTRREMDLLFPDVNHQGIAIRTGAFPYGDENDLLHRVAHQPNALVLALDHLEDPQNVGALLRSAEAVGATGVILPRDRATGITPAVVRASAGASEHLYVVLVTNLTRTFQSLRERDARIFGLEDAPEAVAYDEIDLTGRVTLVIGAEGRGLGRLVRERCDGWIRLPMRGRVTSLNASVAGGIAMFEWDRQNRASRADAG